MNRKFQKAFERVKCENELRENTLRHIQKQLTANSQSQNFEIAVCGRRRENRAAIMLRKSLVPVLCVMLLAVGISGYRSYFTETAYISIDVNPSLELGINRFDRVVSVESYNEDGEIIKSYIDIKNKNYGEAIDLLLKEDVLGAYTDENSWMTFTVAADDTDKKQQIMYTLEGCSNHANVRSHCGEAETALISEAHENGFSFGKYKAYLEVKSCDDSITEEECKDMSMGEIRQRIDSCRVHNMPQENEPVQEDDWSWGGGNGGSSGNGNGGGHSHGHGGGHDSDHI